MKRVTLWLVLVLFYALGAYSQTPKTEIKMKKLTAEERYVIEQKGTEAPFTGKYNNFSEEGTYTCKKCGASLYRSSDKFDAGCGWPSFDDEIAGAVKHVADADGVRTEIVCARCDAHLGHVFLGEGFTLKGVRHCVNSISMEFTPAVKEQVAIYAGGCFWGVEHLMQQQEGVLTVESGYIGGKTKNPTYKEVCTGTTGHIEAVRIRFDATKVSYETLTKLFFEIHDPTQLDRQGPDRGEQYRSEIFFLDTTQKKVAEQLIVQLREKGYDVKTRLTKATEFYLAEEYHQDYYERKGTEPYCHSYVKRF